MSARFKDISFAQAQEIITKDYYEKDASNPVGKVAKPWVFSIILSVIFFLMFWLFLGVSGVKNAPIYPLIIFVIPVNFIVSLFMLLIKMRELTLLKKSLATSFIWIYIGVIISIFMLVSSGGRILIHREWFNFILYLIIFSLGLWIIVYTYRIFLQDTYEQYGLNSKKTKFNQIYRKSAVWVVIVGIILAYIFRNIPGSHGSTAPQWLQYIGVIGLSLIIILIPGFLFLSDIIKGLLIKKYYKEFKVLYKVEVNH